MIHAKTCWNLLPCTCWWVLWNFRHWKTKAIYYHPIFYNVNISYNRFSSILRCWHFVDNEVPRDQNESLYKIKPLLDLVINNWKSLLAPDECIVIDESMMSFRGRISFRQYNPSKAIINTAWKSKLCTEKGFVWNYDIYIGRDPEIADLDKPRSAIVRLYDCVLQLLQYNRLKQLLWKRNNRNCDWSLARGRKTSTSRSERSIRSLRMQAAPPSEPRWQSTRPQ